MLRTKFVGVFALLMTIGVQPSERVAARDPAPQEYGLNVGQRVPISSMRCVVGEPSDRNTCLAGKYRRERVVSVYANDTSDERLAELVRRLNRVAEEDGRLKAYVLLFNVGPLDESAKQGLRRWASEAGATKFDVAVGGRRERYGIPDTAALTVVFSEELGVKFRRDLPAGKLDVAALESLVRDLQKAAR